MKRLPALPNHLADEVAPRLQSALELVGGCIDELRADDSRRANVKHEWLFAIDDVQKRLVELTCRANACRRTGK
jgi:hypothetical protein